MCVCIYEINCIIFDYKFNFSLCIVYYNYDSNVC